MIFLTIACINWIYIGLRAFQNLNLFHHRYLAVAITSLFMASTEVFIIRSIAHNEPSVWLVLALAFGGSAGCITAMKLNQRMQK